MSRESILKLVEEAKVNGATKKNISSILEVSCKTLNRWKKDSEGFDERVNNRFSKSNRLTKEEISDVLRLITSSDYRDKTPMEIVALESEKGRYIASERSIYRIMKRFGLLTHRSKSKAPMRQKPSEFIATGSNQVWTWDISYLLTTIRGEYLYLYLIMDIWDRSIVGWCIHEKECGIYAADFLRKTCLTQNVKPKSLVIHQDNGSPMISSEFVTELNRWGISSYSRPGVSDDNPFSESLFKTLKYYRSYPSKFKNIQHALAWINKFVKWYNNEHLHSSIGFIAPNDRRTGKDVAKLEERRETYRLAKLKCPNRWSKKIRKWDSPSIVILNADKFHQIKEKKIA
ncbi:MAG: IS3 family transposase [Leptospira sp.]|nr:IS3 family transposase [Leptospira sp.]